MNEETRLEIKRLSDIAFDKAETCHALSLQNAALPYEQRKEQAQRYALARYMK